MPRTREGKVIEQKGNGLEWFTPWSLADEIQNYYRPVLPTKQTKSSQARTNLVKDSQQLLQPKEWNFTTKSAEHVSKLSRFKFGTAKLQDKQESTRIAEKGKLEENQGSWYKENTKGYPLKKKVRRRRKRATSSQYG